MYAVFCLISNENKGRATVALGCTKNMASVRSYFLFSGSQRQNTNLFYNYENVKQIKIKVRLELS